MTKIKTYTALTKEINKRTSIAIENVAKIVCNKLMECIDEQYYKDPEFYPNVYQRTEAFLNSAIYDMLGNNKAQIGVDTDSMRYKNGFPAEQVVKYAAQSMHGSSRYQTSTEDFWSAFIDWCDNNIINLLKTELIKQGLNVE